MSVILERDGEYMLFSKGADSILSARLAQSQNEIMQYANSILELHAEDGLRTLMCVQRIISIESYVEWSRRYNEACISLENRDEKMSEMQEEIEKDFEFVGTTAIEDKLQDEVPRSISLFREASMKVWVLTGDKVETAISIGFSTCLLSHNMELLIVTETTEKEVKRQIENIKADFIESNAHALIISGDALIFALEPSLVFSLFDIAKDCISVLCCRVSPKQKQEIVSMVRTMEPKAITLAIGDGANDVNMITAAHVGIGIRGVEGQQAARASDYAISEFRNLKRLLFFHGRESYRRNCHLVLFNFYKNVLLVLPQFWYGIFNIFSGQTLYEKFLYQFYNLFYTSLPIVYYAVLDRQFSGNLLEKRPDMYIPGMKKNLFNLKKFIFWTFSATLQALIIAIISIYTMIDNFVNERGNTDGFWSMGMLVFTNTIIIANIKVLNLMNLHSISSTIIVSGSFSTLIITHLIVNVMKSSELYGSFDHLYDSSSFILGIFIVLVSTSGLDAAFRFFSRCKMDFITEERKVSTMQNKSRISLLTSKIKEHDISNSSHNALNKSITSKRHKGFAFSIEEIKDHDFASQHAF